MWILNIGVCLFIYTLIWAFYITKRKQYCLQMIIIGLFCCPVLKTPFIEINGVYFITFFLVIICLLELKKKTIRFETWVWYYTIFWIFSVGIVLIAGAVNGVINKRIFAVLGGQINIGLLTLECGLLYQTVNSPSKILLHAIIPVNILHAVMGLLQMLSVKWGYIITGQLWASSDRIGPLKTMFDIGAFYRVFGASYSPSMLGGYILTSAAFLIALILTRQLKNRQGFLVLTLTILIGLFAFSKAVILGILIVLVLETVWYVFYRDKDHWIPLKTVVMAVLVSFLLVVVICYPNRLWGQVQYYFGRVLTNPGIALKSRYAENTAYTLLKQHPLVGVGVLAVNGEFIGDSQYITVLHNGGPLLFFVYAVFYGGLFWVHFKKKRILKWVTLISIGIFGVSADVLQLAIIVPFVSYCLHDSFTSHIRTKRKRFIAVEGSI